MSPTINWDSILDKSKSRMGSDDMKKRIEKAAVAPGGPIKPSEAAERFIELMQAEVKSHAGMSVASGGLGPTAIAALTKLSHGDPVKVGDNKYQISVSFDGNMRRDSLAPDYFDEGIENIAALLNKGYSAKHTIYGTWPGHGYADYFNIGSLRQREGAHFIEGAIRAFMAYDAKKYGVVDIQMDDIYK